MSEEKIIASINATFDRIDTSLDRQEANLKEINTRVDKLINRGDEPSPSVEHFQSQEK